MAPGLQGHQQEVTRMATPAVVAKDIRPTMFLELQALESLPCGCVAAEYRARPWDLAVVSLEAKGPHCIFAGHSSGSVLRLGDPFEPEPEEEFDEIAR